jgi:hypothetical protein
MGLTLSSYYQWLNPFYSDQSRKLGREEEMLTYYRRRKRGSKIREIVTYIRRRKRVINRNGGGRKREEEKEIVHQNSNKRGREEKSGVSMQEERPVKKERAIAPCSSPRASFLTPHSTFNWYALLILCFQLKFLIDLIQMELDRI